MRLAMWSGPRNISTAMMYSFSNRSDFCAVDEPFYAAYLARTGLEHPMREAVLASQPQTPEDVVAGLAADAAAAEPLHRYEKHMSQHMLDDFDLAWLGDVQNVFLIRHPARVVASFSDRYDNPTLADLGFVQQAALFERVCKVGQSPLVLDSADIRRDPEGMLRKLCDGLGISWQEQMLSWPAGGCPADGVWAPHWYAAVHRSTGFAGPEGPLPTLNGWQAELAEQALDAYQQLYELRVR